MQKFPMTVEGAEALKAEIHELKSVQRPAIIAAIAEAREHGDLKENAEYHAAREQQGFIEARLADYEARLSNAQIIDVKAIEPTGKVIFGTTITLLNLDSDDEVTYRIVGEHEANVKKGLLSVTSPIARALIGKEEGEEVRIETPGGVQLYEILTVEHL
ncbi:transcription elongation factor GreA [Wohlfahrtiimonas chitiniclastica]|uniref:transcription elongation factor GreA n=1 Tax=Wohlfahrtiimonas chitiniclastica TaxID=400946 RepID=UPI0007B41C25|nr:transcription elongation factor GreA [Wohlfahrtiimonas chitiniclastica]KZS23993.1 transcription elongation factor GreA [Wohlfahrtiimonas chitiniclastica]MDC7253055.1 transcription elongation factor GreA [Wohlfahrtiimonas chitiniclastica]WHR56365.1 transcription elongation factor GreA [Wohlfahrtiimonas chitiniclastica]